MKFFREGGLSLLFPATPKRTFENKVLLYVPHKSGEARLRSVESARDIYEGVEESLSPWTNNVILSITGAIMVFQHLRSWTSMS